MNKQPHIAFIGFGSNLEQPTQQVKRALETLSTHKAIIVLQSSPWYQSKAIGPGQQPDYINGAVKIQTTLDPYALLEQLQKIENQQGRQRLVYWGARTLDLDLLLYEKKSINSNTLQLPHPEMHKRNFVLFPLFDIAPELILPNGNTIANLIAQCNQQGLRKLPATELEAINHDNE